jgi:hypothetical protein
VILIRPSEVLECGEHRRFAVLFSSKADWVQNKMGKRRLSPHSTKAPTVRFPSVKVVPDREPLPATSMDVHSDRLPHRQHSGVHDQSRRWALVRPPDLIS